MKTYITYSVGEINQTDVTIGNFGFYMGEETRVDEVNDLTGEVIKVIK